MSDKTNTSEQLNLAQWPPEAFKRRRVVDEGYAALERLVILPPEQPASPEFVASQETAANATVDALSMAPPIVPSEAHLGSVSLEGDRLESAQAAIAAIASENPHDPGRTGLAEAIRNFGNDN